ncbi:unnamed protein product [Brachionus calyciflorus]|uniref:Uncharacterized protein n=1 Tax=Brachionus calyciflorus TaxID=104777 RepID=A0A813SMT5_9BILA|nr:unnamed protein product [Brachionus calyciflorus]
MNLKKNAKNDLTDIKPPHKTEIKQSTTPYPKTYSEVKTKRVSEPKNFTDENNSSSKNSVSVEILHELIDTILVTKFKDFENRFSGLELLTTSHENHIYEISALIKMLKTDLNHVDNLNSQNHKRIMCFEIDETEKTSFFWLL